MGCCPPGNLYQILGRGRFIVTEAEGQHPLKNSDSVIFVSVEGFLLYVIHGPKGIPWH